MDDAVDINSRCYDRFRRQLAEFGDVLRLYDGELARRRDDRIEVPPGVAIDAIAPAVGAPGFDWRHIPDDRLLQDAFPPVDDSRLLALGEQSAAAGRCEESRDAGAASADALGERPLRHDRQFDLTARVDLLEQHRAAAARETADDLAYPAFADQAGDAFPAAPCGVVHNGKVFGALLDQPLDQRARLADLCESGNDDGRAVLDAAHRLGDGTDEFVDHVSRQRVPAGFKRKECARGIGTVSSPSYAAARRALIDDDADE